MAITTKATLTLPKLKAEPIDCVYIKLEQFIADHARVEMKLDLETIGAEVLSIPMDRIALINETFMIDVINITDGIEENVYTFLGLVSDIQVELDIGEHGWMYIYGSSRSIELERGKFLRTHSDKKLSDIVDRVIEDKVNVQVANDPEYKSKINFSMQYYETDYQYLKRLAWMYSEKLLFNGNNLIFGKIDDGEPVQLEYYKDLIEVKLNSKLISNKFKYYYHNLQEEKVPFDYPIDSTSTFTEKAHSQSKKLNERDHLPEIPIEAPIADDGDLKLLTERRTKTVMNQMFWVTGKTNIYKVTIGELLEIDFGNKMIVNESLGKLRVTRSLHYFYEKDKYYNEFDACQKAHDYFPYYDMQMPVAQPITAIVKNNQDEKKLGRVQLKFDFEKEQCQHWFRCVTPDGGGNPNIGIGKNRGIHFAPELEDRIVLGFMEGNPDKPYVAGSFFHGTNAEGLGGGPGNHIKFIRDKSGTEIVFNDMEGSLKIFSPKGKSTILIDGKGNISMSTPATISLSAKDIKLDASNTISLKAPKSININSENYLELEGKENTELVSDKRVYIQAWQKDLTVVASEIDIKGTTSIRMQSSDTDIM